MSPCNSSRGTPVRGVVHAIICRHIRNLERIHALKAADIESVLCRIRPALVMGMDTTVRAKVVARRHGVELIQL